MDAGPIVGHDFLKEQVAHEDACSIDETLGVLRQTVEKYVKL